MQNDTQGKTRLSIYLIVVSTLISLTTNIATSTIPDLIKPYLWIAWPLLLVFIIVSVYLDLSIQGLIENRGTKQDKPKQASTHSKYEIETPLEGAIDSSHTPSVITYIILLSSPIIISILQWLIAIYVSTTARGEYISIVDITEKSLKYGVSFGAIVALPLSIMGMRLFKSGDDEDRQALLTKGGVGCAIQIAALIFIFALSIVGIIFRLSFRLSVDVFADISEMLCGPVLVFSQAIILLFTRYISNNIIFSAIFFILILLLAWFANILFVRLGIKIAKTIEID